MDMDLYKPSRPLIIVAWLVLATTFGLMGYYTYDSFWPFYLVRFEGMVTIARDFTKCETPIHTFHPGDLVPLRFKGEKFTDDVPEVVTKMINDSVITLPVSHMAKDAGRFEYVDLDRRIPINAHEGLFYFEISFIFNRNFARKAETYKVKTEPFRIEARKAAHHDYEQDEALVKKILRELQKKHRREWQQYQRERSQFEKDRKTFEKGEHVK